MQLHIEERKVERLETRRLTEVFIYVRGKQSNGTGKTRERLFKSFEEKKKFNLEKIGVKHEFEISTLGDWENGGSFDQDHDVGNAKTTLIEMNKIGS